MGQTLDRIAVFYQNDDYGKAGLAGVERAMQKRNIKVLASGTVERNTVDVANATWSNTTCPDGTNSDDDGGTCVDNLI